MEINYFPKLDLPSLKGHARTWAERYPVISKINLYRGVDKEFQYVLIVEAPQVGKGDPSFHEFQKNWLPTYRYTKKIRKITKLVDPPIYRRYPNPLRKQLVAPPIYLELQNDIRGVYKTDPTTDQQDPYEWLTKIYLKEWLILSKEPEQKPNDFNVRVVQDSKCVLFERTSKAVKQKQDTTGGKTFSGQNDVAEKNSSSESIKDKDEAYIFIQEGPSWKIVYEGKTLSGLRGNGFAYIHHLVKNRPKPFHPRELSLITDPPENTLKQAGQAGEIEEFAHVLPLPGYKVTDEKARKQYLEEIKSLKEEIAEAENNNDFERKNRKENELEELQSFLLGDMKPGRKVKAFADEDEKSKQRVGKSINRALDNIKKHDPKAYMHFHNALKTIFSYSLSYKPNPDINWLA